MDQTAFAGGMALGTISGIALAFIGVAMFHIILDIGKEAGRKEVREKERR